MLSSWQAAIIIAQVGVPVQVRQTLRKLLIPNLLLLQSEFDLWTISLAGLINCLEP